MMECKLDRAVFGDCLLFRVGLLLLGEDDYGLCSKTSCCLCL